MRGRQLSFLPNQRLEHGGQTRIGKRKTARPLDPKRPLHLVLRSSQARGQWSLLRPASEKRIKALIDRSARKYGIRIYRYVNVGNHLHLLIMTKTRRAFLGFIREITGAIAALVTGARKSHELERGKFWDFLPYTRIVSWGREFRTLEKYFIKNLFEGAGLLSRRAKAAGVKIISIASWAPDS